MNFLQLALRRPLSVVVAGANVNDHKLLNETLSTIVVDRPASTQGEEHLCMDARYANEESRDTAEDHGYEPHIRPLDPEKKLFLLYHVISA